MRLLCSGRRAGAALPAVGHRVLGGGAGRRPAGALLAEGWSRRDGEKVHAEEAAAGDLGGAMPSGTTVYSSPEPCGVRASRPRTCTQLILDAGVERVVFAWREPSLFVDCEGAEVLRKAGLEVVELTSWPGAAREVNRHLSG